MKPELVVEIECPVMLKGFNDSENSYNIIGFTDRNMVIERNKMYMEIEPIKPGNIYDSIMEKDGSITTGTIASYFLAYTRFKRLRECKKFNDIKTD